MTKEKIYRKILGNVNWKTMHELPPGAFVTAADMLSEVSVEEKAIVADAADVLNRYGWFVEAGLTDEPPWSDNLPWEKLIKIAPWDKQRLPSRNRINQLLLF